MQGRVRADPLKPNLDESTEEFEGVRQSRLELLTLKKQRKKVANQPLRLKL